MESGSVSVTLEDTKQFIYYIRITDKAGNVYLVVVDGRSKGNAEGVTIEEFTKICAWLGMRDAVNLDGGGSSTMWCSDWGVVSYPCRNKKFDHAGDRKVSSCLLVTLKK